MATKIELARSQSHSSSHLSAHIMQKPWLVWLVCLLVAGCNSSKPPEGPVRNEQTQLFGEERKGASAGLSADSIDPSMVVSPAPLGELVNEPNAKLLTARLSPEQLEQGWIRLHDGHEMAGWFFVGNANWTYDGGMITADGGEPSLFCTNFQVSDFELMVDFNCAARTDSGICLRTSVDPRDVARDCYELSIAPTDSEYPTGSLVKRQKADMDKVGEVEPNQWHTYHAIVQGDQVKVWLDGKPVIEYTDQRQLRRGYIGLQHNLGVVRFRNILLRPLGGQDLDLGKDWQNDWKLLSSAGQTFKVETDEDGLSLRGGPGQLESKGQWDDFVLQATYEVANANVDSGILFRSLPDRYNEAYECQIYHGPMNLVDKANVRLQTGALNIPSKGETANARILASEGTSPTYLTIIAEEGQFQTYVNGLLVADVADTREVSANPRSGFRREAGTIALQALEENCDITFQRLKITPIVRK